MGDTRFPTIITFFHSFLLDFLPFVILARVQHYLFQKLPVPVARTHQKRKHYVNNIEFIITWILILTMTIKSKNQVRIKVGTEIVIDNEMRVLKHTVQESFNFDNMLTKKKMRIILDLPFKVIIHTYGITCTKHFHIFYVMLFWCIIGN